MDEIEMMTMGEAARMTEHLADLVGNIILQLMQKQDYVEEQGIKALLTHVRSGRGTFTTSASEVRSGEFKDMLKAAHIPYVEIVHQNPETKEKTMFYVYRDCDAKKMKNVQKEFVLLLDASCHEVDLDTFEKITEWKSYGTVYGLSKEEVYAFREAVTRQEGQKLIQHDIGGQPTAEGLRFCVVADGDRYAVMADDVDALENVVADMAYYLSGNRGHAYKKQLENFNHMQESFDQRTMPKKGGIIYVVDANNPRNFISIGEQDFTTHSVGCREERKPDGGIRRILYDARHVTYPGRDPERLRQLALEMGKPMVLSSSDFPLVREISRTKEAILADDFVERFDAFVLENKKTRADITRCPRWKPLYRREELLGYSNLPMNVIEKVREADIPDLYCNGADIAYLKEAEPAVNELLDACLFQGMKDEEREEKMAQYRSDLGNEAINFMLAIEPMEMAGLHAGYRLPVELMNDTQKEAAEFMDKKEIRKQTMDRKVAEQIRNQMIDRRLAQEIER